MTIQSLASVTLPTSTFAACSFLNEPHLVRMRTCVLMQPSRRVTYVGRRSRLHVQLTLLPGDGDGDGYSDDGPSADVFCVSFSWSQFAFHWEEVRNLWFDMLVCEVQC